MTAPFKRNEDTILQDIAKYIESTYGQHYAGTSPMGDNIQLIDLFEANDDLMSFARTNAMKYVSRFGKKEGDNVKDLFKAIHAIVWMIDLTMKKEAGKPLSEHPADRHLSQRKD